MPYGACATFLSCQHSRPGAGQLLHKAHYSDMMTGKLLHVAYDQNAYPEFSWLPHAASGTDSLELSLLLELRALMPHSPTALQASDR